MNPRLSLDFSWIESKFNIKRILPPNCDLFCSVIVIADSALYKLLYELKIK